MGLRALPLSPSQNGFFPNSGITQLGVNQNLTKHGAIQRRPKFRRVSAKLENEEEEPKKDKQSLFGMVTDALDFAQVRSEADAQLLEEAREATKSGEKMSKEQVYMEQAQKYPLHMEIFVNMGASIPLSAYLTQFSKLGTLNLQYGALRRKIGGTYKDFFKSYIEGKFTFT